MSPILDQVKILKWLNRGPCTMFPEGNWAECCYLHDEYCLASAELQDKHLRMLGDKLLLDCVTKKGYPKVAKLMYFGVRSWANLKMFFTGRV